MNYLELERLLLSLGFKIKSHNSHVKFTNGSKTFVIPFRKGKSVNRMLSRRVLKEAGYEHWRKI